MTRARQKEAPEWSSPGTRGWASCQVRLTRDGEAEVGGSKEEAVLTASGQWVSTVLEPGSMIVGHRDYK